MGHLMTKPLVGLLKFGDDAEANVRSDLEDHSSMKDQVHQENPRSISDSE